MADFLGGMNFGDLGGAVSSIFGGMGDLAEAKSYKKAADIATQNAAIANESTRIQEAQAGRNIFQTIGKQQAQVAGAGLAGSGSAIDLLRSSQQQGELTRQLIGTQGLIQQQGFLQEANAYTGMADAAKAAGAGGIFGGIMKGVGAVASVFALSDVRLKEDITYVGPSAVAGVSLYDFRYVGGEHVFRGVMAQEVLKVKPDLVAADRDGYLMVNYAGLGITLELVD